MHFLRTFFLTSSILTCLLLGFIYAVDPYDKYGINVFGFETKAVAMARENKFNMVEHARKDYRAFIIGSSSAHRIHTADVKELTGLETFNYAVQHTTPEDYLAITRHILTKAKPKLILFQMDFYGLNSNFKTDTRFYTSPLKDYLDGKRQAPMAGPWIDPDYLTLGALSDSLKVIWVNMTGTAKHLYLEDGNYQKERPHTGPVEVTQFSYENYQIDERRLGLLREMRELCEKKGVKLIVWSAPYSYEHIQRIEADPALARALTDFKMALVSVFGEIFDFTDPSIREFSSGIYFRDSSHPERELFKILLKQMLTDNNASHILGKKISR